jgi:hypothetical protein
MQHKQVPRYASSRIRSSWRLTATDRAAGELLRARWGDTKSVDSSFKVALVVIGLIFAGMLPGTSIVLLWNVHRAPVKPQVLEQVRPFSEIVERIRLHPAPLWKAQNVAEHLAQAKKPS